MKDKTKQSKEVKSKRQAYPGLSKRKNSPTSHEYVDQDYLHKLGPKELKWLSDFQEEFYRGNFQHGGKKLHNSKKKQKECYNRNNARNRDILSLAKVKGMVDGNDVSTALENKATNNNSEDVLLTLLDEKNKLKKT